jgi:ABC-type transport system involved in multi-copper enzyme maturation permease subunit
MDRKIITIVSLIFALIFITAMSLIFANINDSMNGNSGNMTNMQGNNAKMSIENLDGKIVYGDTVRYYVNNVKSYNGHSISYSVDHKTVSSLTNDRDSADYIPDSFKYKASAGTAKGYINCISFNKV